MVGARRRWASLIDGNAAAASVSARRDGRICSEAGWTEAVIRREDAKDAKVL